MNTSPPAESFDLRRELARYKQTSLITPYEQTQIERIEKLLTTTPHCFERIPGGHITSSAWIVNQDRSKTLLTHHRKLGKWLQLGGHNDGSSDCRASALREATEESGIEHFTLAIDGIFDIDIHPIPGTCAWHYDIRFLLVAPHEIYMVSEESYNLAWVIYNEINRFSNESSILRMAQKAIEMI